MGELKVRESDGGVVFPVKVVPGGSRTTSAGTMGGMMKVKLSVPAEKGRANASLVGFLAKYFGVSKKSVTIFSGRTARIKQLRIEGLSASTLREKLGRD